MYYFRVTLATAGRVLRQYSHDKRSIGLIFLVLIVLMSLLWWLFSENSSAFDHIAPALLSVFPFISMFLITSVTTLRERTTGNIGRMLVAPIGKLDIIDGYTLSFVLMAIAQSLVASSFVIFVFGMNVAGPLWFVVLVTLLDSLLGATLGLLVSSFAVPHVCGRRA